MNLNEFSKEVHANAVNHGWWDEERKLPEILALIHSEWSEALEEARAGRPMHYFPCNDGGLCVDDRPEDHYECGSRIYNPKNPTAPCSARSKKPEGIAVELIDGCIRILDFFGAMNVNVEKRYMLAELIEDAPDKIVPDDISELVTLLHWYISLVFAPDIRSVNPDWTREDKIARLYEAMGVACKWIQNHGEDPEKLMLEKHEYNKTRPYKHGKKF